MASDQRPVVSCQSQNPTHAIAALEWGTPLPGEFTGNEHFLPPIECVILNGASPEADAESKAPSTRVDLSTPHQSHSSFQQLYNRRVRQYILARVQVFDIRTARSLATICLFVAVGAFLYGVRETLVVFLFAILFAYLLEPVVRRVQDSRLVRGSRAAAIAVTYLCVGGVLTTLALIFGPRLAFDTRQLVQSLPGLLDKVANGSIVWQFGSRHGWSFDSQYRIGQYISSHQGDILNWASKAGASAAHFLANALWLILIPILAIFFLADGRRFAQQFIGAFERRDQRRLFRGILDDLDQMLAHYIFAQILLAGISLVAYSIALTLFRFPYSLALALAAGVMEFVPVAGPLVAAAAILGVGFLVGYPHLGLVVLFLAAWRMCQDYIISPRVMGGKLELHPLAAIAAVLMGGELGGVLGVFLSIPVAATIRVIWKHWQEYSPAMDANAAPKLAEVALRPPGDRAAS